MGCHKNSKRSTELIYAEQMEKLLLSQRFCVISTVYLKTLKFNRPQIFATWEKMFPWAFQQLAFEGFRRMFFRI